MGKSVVKASYLVEKFKYMVDNKWKYQTNAAGEGFVDCSGAFYYWYSKAGSYMYHGSNTIWRRYATKKGAIGEIDLVPGMAVFKRREWTLNDHDNQYYLDSEGNFYHIGLYIGNGIVAEAKDTAHGCVYSNLRIWQYCAQLKNTEYDLDENSAKKSDESYVEELATNIGHVSTPGGGTLNLRKKPSTDRDSTILKRIPNGTEITLLSKQSGWYKVSYLGTNGYCSAEYIIEGNNGQSDEYGQTWMVSCQGLNRYNHELLINFLNENNIEYISYEEGGD